MRYAGLLLIGIAGVGVLADWAFGYALTYAVGYGAFAIMAAMISGTFFWLWATRATPLALGMGFSWAGAASVMGWWWVYHLAAQPPAMAENAALFVFLGFYFVGAILHFVVIQRSMGMRRWVFVVPVVLAVAVSSAVVGLT
jgi:hypothetical protein